MDVDGTKNLMVQDYTIILNTLQHACHCIICEALCRHYL